jgi:hypothetical protein
MRNIFVKTGLSLSSQVVLILVLLGCGGESEDSPVTSNSTYITAIDGPAYTLSEQELVASHERVFIDLNLAKEDPNGPKFYRMVKDLGGFNEFNTLIESGDQIRIETVLSRYGIGYSTGIPGVTAISLNPAESPKSEHVSPMNIGDCIQYYPATDRGKTFRFGSTTVFIDPSGRPGYATWQGGPTSVITPGVRDTYCQSLVNKWGVPGDEAGHLVANSLGGWGGRANLVPQNGPFNRGPWRAVEAVPAVCAKTYPTTYTVIPQYLSATDLRPARLMAQIVILYAGFFPITASIISAPNVVPSVQTQQASQDFRTLASRFCV